MKTLSIPIALWLVYFAAVPALQAQDTSSREDITVFVKASRQDGENNRSGNNSYSYNPTGKAIGEIAYEQSVSQTGGKVISVPIQTIPCQLPPTISLTYNSQSGNGPVGYGWQIGGLSTIMMTNKSVYYHNMAECADVMDNTSYPYALDGNLIIPNEVGVLQANYPYSTIKGNILISRQEDMYTDTFQALYPDGRRASYGISNDNPQYLFPITLQTDVDGNKIVYQYITDPQSPSLDEGPTHRYYYIQNILFDYDANGTAHGKISFEYTSEQNPAITYYAGAERGFCYRLTRIVSWSDQTPVFTYDLTYQLVEDSFLVSRIDCTNANQEVLNPLVFEYGLDVGQGSPVTAEMTSISSNYFNGVPYVFKRGKLQEDSYDDGLIVYPASCSAGTMIDVYPSLTSSTPLQITAQGRFQTIDAVDLDGEGVDEIVRTNIYNTQSYPDSTTVWIVLRRVNYDSFGGRLFNIYGRDGTDPVRVKFSYGDFRSDGTKMLYAVSYHTGTYHSEHLLYDIMEQRVVTRANLFDVTTANAGDLFVQDMDGDGAAEICLLGENNLTSWRLSGNTLVPYKTYDGIRKSDLDWERTTLTDLNGDGYPDFIVMPPLADPSIDPAELEIEDEDAYEEFAQTYMTWTLFKNDGTGYHKQSERFPFPRHEGESQVFLDINKDGCADLLWQWSNVLNVFVFDEHGFSMQNFSWIQVLNNNSFKIVSANEFQNWNSKDFAIVTETAFKLFHYRDDLSRKRLLGRITDSFGKVSSISYQDITDEVQSGPNGREDCPADRYHAHHLRYVRLL